MTREEVKTCLSVIKVTYPMFANKLTAATADIMINVWEEMFKDYEYAVVSMAIYRLIKIKKDFPPDIATITEYIDQMAAIATGEPTTADYWGLIKSALRNSLYDSEKEFDKLPDVLKQYVGGASQLRSWADMDTSTLDSVIYSQFLKNIDICKRRAKESAELTPVMREMLSAQAAKLKMPEGYKALSPAEENKKRNQILDYLEEN